MGFARKKEKNWGSPYRDTHRRERCKRREVCFDGGCVVDEDAGLLLDELENELRELSETEQRLRREGAMMVIEKLRSDETLGGRLGSAGGRLGSAGAAAVTVPTFSREAGESVISQRLGGKTGPTVWSEFGALAASLKDRPSTWGRGFRTGRRQSSCSTRP